MKTIEYTIKDELGIHARPAGALVKEASKYKSDIRISKNENSADLKKLFSLMGLNVKLNDVIKITAEGEDEEKAINALETFLNNNL